MLSESSLPRLTAGIAALADGRSRDSSRLLSAETSSQFNDIIAQGVRAWAVLDRDGLAAADALLAETRSGDLLLDGLVLATRAIMQIHGEQDQEALDTLDLLWENGVRLAVTTEYQARLLARAGRPNDALDILTIFSATIGQNASIEALKNKLEEGEALTLPRPTIKDGAALAVYMPAAALASQTSNDLAGVYFALALHLDPDLHVARTLWGDALDKGDRRQDAIAMLETVPETSVFFATARGQLAWVLRRENRNDEALKTAKTALTASPDRNLKIQLGDLFRSLDQLEDAERIFSEVIEADAQANLSDWRILYARGAARQRLGQWRDAETDLLAAVDLAPDQPALLNYLGYSWIDRGENLEQGFSMIQKAVELRPNAGFIVDSLGWAYYRLGQYEEAVTHLERAVELSPGEPVLNDHLGDAYWRVGRKLEAGFQWTRALRLDPDSSETALLEAKLETGLDDAGALLAQGSALPDRAGSP